MIRATVIFLSAFLGLSSFQAHASKPKQTCGMVGTLNERIAACSRAFPKDSHFESGWTLVTSVAQNGQIWRDDKTGMVWSDNIRKELFYSEAAAYCPVAFTQ